MPKWARISAASSAERRLARQLTRICASGLTLRPATVAVAARLRGQADKNTVVVTRTGERFEVLCSEAILLDHDGAYARLCPLLKLIGDAPLATLQAVADLSDGEASGPGMLSFCSRDSGAILIPDHEFVRTLGYRFERDYARASRMAWEARSDRFVWRGSTTGVGVIAKDQLSAADADLIPRVRLCLELREFPGADVKISGVVQSAAAVADRERLAKAGIFGAFIAPVFWHSFRYAIDIDGNTNAWSNLFSRLVMGCCVVKIASRQGYRQWYYDDLEPWRHYVPVKSDLSDLRERITWCRANSDECRQIAARGQEFAMARSYEVEIASAIRRLCQASANGMLRSAAGL